MNEALVNTSWPVQALARRNLAETSLPASELGAVDVSSLNSLCGCDVELVEMPVSSCSLIAAASLVSLVWTPELPLGMLILSPSTVVLSIITKFTKISDVRMTHV